LAAGMLGCWSNPNARAISTRRRAPSLAPSGANTELHDTVNAYLDGKIDQWYFQTSGKGVVFIVNASTVEDAKAILEKFPLGQAGLMGFDYIPIGPLNPLRIINDMVR